MGSYEAERTNALRDRQAQRRAKEMRKWEIHKVNFHKRWRDCAGLLLLVSLYFLVTGEGETVAGAAIVSLIAAQQIWENTLWLSGKHYSQRAIEEYFKNRSENFWSARR